MDKIIVCKECFKEFQKWLCLQALHDSYPTYTKKRQTRAYELYGRLTMKKDIEIKELNEHT